MEVVYIRVDPSHRRWRELIYVPAACTSIRRGAIEVSVTVHDERSCLCEIARSAKGVKNVEHPIAIKKVEFKNRTVATNRTVEIIGTINHQPATRIRSEAVNRALSPARWRRYQLVCISLISHATIFRLSIEVSQGIKNYTRNRPIPVRAARERV